ncbi:MULTISPECIES: hypothetical protein [unclassified Bradyrhizobium]|uniref:hypothetical protein n=1 Tax=unclassified Bradyrhizobium TaxID=2631580 RepID=UPI0028F159CE|nr:MULTISPECIES: hypothetical protein [unclassified Bradyrhizobium]
MPIRALPRLLLIFGLGCSATGCSHMPVTSMVKLARVDFQTSDPAQLRAAVKLPISLRPLPGGVVLRIVVRRRGAAEEQREFVLRELAEPAALAREAEAATRIYAYRLDEADAAKLLAFRAELMERKSAGGGGSVTISIAPKACKTFELPEGPIYVTTYLRTAETVEYVTLARDVDLRSLASDHPIVDVPRCQI